MNGAIHALALLFHPFQMYLKRHCVIHFLKTSTCQPSRVYTAGALKQQTITLQRCRSLIKPYTCEQQKDLLLFRLRGTFCHYSWHVDANI